MRLNPYPISKNDYKNLQAICPLNSYKVVSPHQIPVALPEQLIDKSFRAIVVNSGDLYAAVTMINLLRVDKNDKAVDQQPFICAYYNDGKNIDLTAGIIQHGNWLGRTIYPEDAFFRAIEGSGIILYYPFVGVPSKESGHISELTPDAHKEAFWNGTRLIKGDAHKKLIKRALL